MRAGVARVLVAAALGLICLAGCETQNRLSDAYAPTSADPTATGTLSSATEPNAATPGLLGRDPNDDLSLGKKHYRAANFGLAEKHFRRAVELHPDALEAWVGLAASYDRLRRFDLADRAYQQAIRIGGPTPEILNNQGFSHMLRGDYATARKILLAAKAQDPDNPYVKNNLALLDKSARKRKSVR